MSLETLVMKERPFLGNGGQNLIYLAEGELACVIVIC